MKYVLGAVFSVLIGLASSIDLTYAAVTVTARAAPVTVRASAPSIPRTSMPRASAPLVRSGSSTNMIPMYVMLPVLAASASSSHAGSRSEVEVATPLLTVCTTEEFVKAQKWQEDCNQLDNISSRMCPILSYFRYCKEATPDEVRGLKPAKPNYTHVYIKP